MGLKPSQVQIFLPKQRPLGYFFIPRRLVGPLGPPKPPSTQFIKQMLGQAHQYTIHAKDNDYGKQRYYTEANRLYGVLDRQLATHEFVAGKDLSIADMAIFPWTRTVWRQGVDLNYYPHVVRWRRMLITRPAFLAGVQVGAAARAETKDMEEQDWVDQFSGVAAPS